MKASNKKAAPQTAQPKKQAAVTTKNYYAPLKTVEMETAKKGSESETSEVDKQQTTGSSDVNNKFNSPTVKAEGASERPLLSSTTQKSELESAKLKLLRILCKIRKADQGRYQASAR
jgi:hypothetical protein